jgi:hypothetical protein
VLLGLAAVGMATARYLPPAGMGSADASGHFADARGCGSAATRPLRAMCEPQPAFHRVE